MIGRWYASLSAFDLDITYVSGQSQLVADPLSRLFKEVRDDTYEESSNPAVRHACHDPVFGIGCNTPPSDF